MAGSFTGTFPTPSDGTYGVGNIKVEGDVTVMEESLIAIKKEEDIGIKQEEIPDYINVPIIKAERDEVSYVCVCLLIDILNYTFFYITISGLLHQFHYWEWKCDWCFSAGWGRGMWWASLYWFGWCAYNCRGDIFLYPCMKRIYICQMFPKGGTNPKCWYSRLHLISHSQERRSCRLLLLYTPFAKPPPLPT
jgi:hypothetical protein